jgi:transglutaminase-like putative cysteine protease
MQPEDSSPHSQAPTTYPYPEPAQSSPHTHIPLLLISCIQVISILDILTILRNKPMPKRKFRDYFSQNTTPLIEK